MWYQIELAASENTEKHGGYVEVIWMHGFSIFDYDKAVFDRMAMHFQLYWPARPVAFHVCCPSTPVFRTVMPIIHALLNRWFRSRVLVHNVSPESIMNVLREYGILPEMLPAKMGGTLDLDTDEWIAQRRAAEMEELE